MNEQRVFFKSVIKNLFTLIILKCYPYIKEIFMGFFNNFKIGFGFNKNNHHDNHNKKHLNHFPGRHHHFNHRELAMVKSGDGVYAWIEKQGMFFNGDIPGVSGIMSVRMADSFEECYDKLCENINNSISVKFSSFRQEVSYEEIQSENPDAEIVFVPIRKR